MDPGVITIITTLISTSGTVAVAIITNRQKPQPPKDSVLRKQETRRRRIRLSAFASTGALGGILFSFVALQTGIINSEPSSKVQSAPESLMSYLVTESEGKEIPISKLNKSLLFQFNYKGKVVIKVEGRLHAKDCSGVPGAQWDRTIAIYLNNATPFILSDESGKDCGIQISASPTYDANGKTFVYLEATKSNTSFSENTFSNVPIILETWFKITVEPI